MKKIKVIILLFIIVFLSSCSAQENINPNIFIERTNKKYPEIVFDLKNSFYKDNSFVCFASYSNQKNVAVRMMFDENEYIKKISISAGKNDNVYYIFNAVGEIYAPDENNKNILNNFKISTDNFRYHIGKEHTYSVVSTDNMLYFEIFNNRLNDYTIPQLTLKSNDKTEF